jgi:hypothetical protein
MMSMYTRLRTKAAGHRTLLPLQHGALPPFNVKRPQLRASACESAEQLLIDFFGIIKAPV